MDKNTIIGLGLIGVILALFTFFNQPSEEELKERMAQQEQVAQQQKDAVEKADEQEKKVTKPVEKAEPVAVLGENGEPVVDSLGNAVYTIADATPAKKEGIVKARDVEEETYILENEKIKVILTNKGGGVKSVFLKEHQTYDDFSKNAGTDKINPLELFNEE